MSALEGQNRQAIHVEALPFVTPAADIGSRISAVKPRMVPAMW